ncbi:hypothetical protein [Clostridium cellulovorans]|nr:hypothetical protein [Clostridium cellulovorans]
MKLTLEELNNFSISEFLTFADIWTQDYKEANNTTTKATQGDIDKQFFS